MLPRKAASFGSIASMALFCAGLILAAPAMAQDALSTLAQRQANNRADLEQITRDMTLSQERREDIVAEIETLKDDQRALTAAMIQAVKTERKLGQEAETIGDRLGDLREQEGALKRSLAARRDVLAEVLGALQRMGLNPPPAILVRPEDALGSVRSAILLGAVVPELRGETQALAADLAEMARLTGSITAEREKLMATVAEQAAERERLAILIREKSTLQQRSESVLAAEEKRAAELTARAGSLQDLIQSLEKEIGAVRQAEEKAREEAEAARQAALEESRPVPETTRLAQPVPFDQLVGKASLPVAGRLAGRFGEADETGMKRLGDIVTTQSGAIVTAPADGTVIYAGPFRSYGQLLILNAGGSYHIVLAGMGRINVALGQTVLAGEPIGAMGEARLASAGPGNASAAPQLYIELRKDGKPVDPAPWWAERFSGRTGNDT